MQLEALAQEDESDHEAYPLNFTESVDSDLLLLEPRPLWEKPLADLAASTPLQVMAERFHRGLPSDCANEFCAVVREGTLPLTDTIIFSGGVFQKHSLLDQM